MARICGLTVVVNGLDASVQPRITTSLRLAMSAHGDAWRLQSLWRLDLHATILLYNKPIILLIPVFVLKLAMYWAHTGQAHLRIERTPN